MISVIIPVYNVESTLARCLDSLIDQDDSLDYEIICIDDSSTDGSLDILKDYSRRYPEMITVLQNSENQGLGLTRNHGLDCARGEYVTFVDSDDYVKPDYLRTYSESTNGGLFDVIIGGYIRTDGTHEHAFYPPNSEWSKLCFSSAWGKLFKREIFHDQRLRYTDVSFSEDIEVDLYLFSKELSTSIIRYAGYYYCDNPASIMQSNVDNTSREECLIGIYSDYVGSAHYKRLDKKKQDMIAYFFASNMLNTILKNGRGSSQNTLDQKYELFISALNELFPDYRSNEFFTIRGPKGLNPQVRLGMSAFVLSLKLHIAKQLFKLYILLNK